MKKIISVICAAAIAITLTACSNEGGSSTPASSNGSVPTSTPVSSAAAVSSSGSGTSSVNSETSSASSEANSVSSEANSVSSDVSATSSVTSAAESTPAGNNGSEHPLSNKNADAVTQKVYNYLCEIYGTHMLTGQMEAEWKTDSKGNKAEYEMELIQNEYGKLPAVRGIDYMNGENGSIYAEANQRAIEWWNKGGLVTICWHTGINGKGYDESKNDVPDFDKLLTDGTEENKAMLANWDRAAAALAELQNAGVPVLWRPFHELDGGWFWWSKGGPENFKKLWIKMYDYYTNEKKLNNLIWVFGYTGKQNEFDVNGDDVKEKYEWKEWYVGDEYCDIVGSDTYDYNKNDAGGRVNKTGWELLDGTGSTKPRAFHECGRMGSADEFKSEGCTWLWFMVWHGGSSPDYVGNSNIKHNSENFKSMYDSEFTITLDELPSFK